MRNINIVESKDAVQSFFRYPVHFGFVSQSVTTGILAMLIVQNDQNFIKYLLSFDIACYWIYVIYLQYNRVEYIII